MAIYDRSRDDLSECIKIAFMNVGLMYGKDFDVSVYPMGATRKDYNRVCAYF